MAQLLAGIQEANHYADKLQRAARFEAVAVNTTLVRAAAMGHSGLEGEFIIVMQKQGSSWALPQDDFITRHEKLSARLAFGVWRCGDACARRAGTRSLVWARRRA